MEKNNNLSEFEFKGMSVNGFLMILVNTILLGITVYCAFYAIETEEAGGQPLWYIIAAAVFLIATILTACGFSMLEPNEAKVLTFFGKYSGTFKKNGFYWINPLLTAKKVSLRARNLNGEPIKVNDKTGNPIMIGLVVVWRLKDTYKAIFDIDTEVAGASANSTAARMNLFESFVSIQSDSALREVAGMYAYDNEGENNEVTLRDGSEETNNVLTQKLNERLDMAGLEVVEARINYLAYAPEIAAVMLRRQQAAAIISAREKIVEGAVSMVRMALDRLSAEQVVELDEDQKAAMVSNLLVVLCAEEPAQPVINSGTLHH